ncbi:MAG: M48 family metallopeptidase [Treponema sp.]|nr:M48 family metallopeptidase [Treponema sp.]
MKNKSALSLLLFIAAGVLSAQSIDFSGALSRMESAIDSSQEEFSLQDSYYLGRSAAAHILGSYRVYTEKPEITNYLNLICMALAVNSPSPNWYNGYHVIILDDPALTAYSTSGGHIFISRGLIELTSSEDMLAAVIAHELAHIQLKHGTAQIKNDRLMQQFAQERFRISQSPASNTGQLFSDTVNEIVQTLLSGGYSQLQEFEADSAAVSLLESAGYNPGSLLELLGVLERLQGYQWASLNKSHPLSFQRIDNLRRQMIAARYRSPDNSAARRARFNRIMERD